MPDSSCSETAASAPAKAETRSERKRRCILEAARALFADHGYAATSIDMVVERAGVSKPTVYGHFKSKDDLFAAAVQAQADAFTGHTCEVMSLPAEKGIRAVGQMYLDMVTGPEALAMHRAIAAEGHNFPELAQTFYESGPARVAGIMEEYLRALDARGALAVPDPGLAAEMFLGMLRVAFYRAVFGLPNTARCRNVVVDEAVRVMLSAYAASTPAGGGQEHRE
ncbi:TetR/AcrR family transcriptional regulator [Caenispirillum salinarum]|uniref:TetR/AcrR family transcriptional regulator n=1 Tax=Caenispirillum salinarum TaxID=859058 RepID=UPI00385154B9